jgi:predicted nucleic acid-binding protein
MPRRYVLDTNCFIKASRSETAAAALADFSARAAPFLYLSSVVAAELVAGTPNQHARKVLEDEVLGPYRRRDRVLTPSKASWDILGRALSQFVWTDGLELRRMPRSFMLDILLAHSCRDNGAVLISNNARDLQRIRRIFSFDWVLPFPDLVG